ncbi:MAG TPA: rRNA adenine N(6)-methyltransferase family protein [Gaiellaceae bacterium]|nr:rRNA adenine N(6)-methyltransferase family protein [Gaiellaceae bacterium]
MAVRPRRRRGHGQHFLRSSKLAAELVRAAGIGPGDLVLDLGAGTGMLTAALLDHGASVVAIEFDTELATGLRKRFPRARVVEDDLLRAAFPSVRFKVVANLPFGSSTAILRRLLDPQVLLESADVIVDWHLASKRASVWPGTQLSACWGAWFDLSVVRRLPRFVFAPSPSVDAGLLRAVRRSDPLVPASEHTSYQGFLARGYRDGLRAVATPRQLKRLEAELGFARHARPRDLDAAQWANLWRAVRQSV